MPVFFLLKSHLKTTLFLLFVMESSKLTVEIYKILSKRGYLLTPTKYYLSGNCTTLLSRGSANSSDFVAAQYCPNSKETTGDFTGFIKCVHI